MDSLQPLNPKDTTPAYLRARNQLIAWGAVTILIYLSFVYIFPIVPLIYRPGKMLDIELILVDGHKHLIWIYILGLCGLFFADRHILRIVHKFSKVNPDEGKSLRKWVLGIGAASGFILIGLYPITAIDVALYVVRARLWTLYGANPITALPANFPQDQYSTLAGEFAKEASPYGPLWELVAQIPMQLGFIKIASGIISMKVISLFSYICMVWLIGWYAGQEVPRYSVSRVTAMAFFALNPLVLLEAIGNGHNDMLMLVFILCGLILWQRDQWAWATLAFTLATLTKATGLLILPLFGVSVLVAAENWRSRIARGLGVIAIFSITSILLYRAMGPFPDVLTGAIHAAVGRRGFSPAYAMYVIVQAILLDQTKLVLPLARDLFILYYVYLLVLLILKRITFNEAGFAVFTGQLLLGAAFRIWYPIWLIPFAVTNLNSRTFWRTFLFSLTAEFSILSYFILWRWVLAELDWGLNGPLRAYWNYWTVMTPLTVSWTFSIPFVAEFWGKWRNRERFETELWI